MAKLNWNSNTNREHRLRNVPVVNTPNVKSKPRKWDCERAKQHSKVPNTDTHIIPSTIRFGKFKGTLISDLPTWYLEWAVKTVVADFQHPALAAELQRRQR
jgi:uncharacterized protein (DUF3820 family)